MGPWSQETLLQVARTQHLALPEGDVTEVMAGRTAFVILEGCEVSAVHKAPLRHTFTESTPVLAVVGWY